MLPDLCAINVYGVLYLKPFYVWAKQCDICEGEMSKEFKNNTSSNQRLGVRSPPVIIVASCRILSLSLCERLRLYRHITY